MEERGILCYVKENVEDERVFTLNVYVRGVEGVGNVDFCVNTRLKTTTFYFFIIVGIIVMVVVIIDPIIVVAAINHAEGGRESKKAYKSAVYAM